jgi:regulator of cell morphogenesis and NO signaling
VTITESTTIADIARDVPSSVRVFQRHGIDFCCGGKRPVGTVCREHSVKFADLVSAIDASRDTSRSEARDWSREPLPDLIDHIVTTYHQPLDEELPRLEAMASKVAHAHGARAPHLARLEAIVNELSDDLRIHMRKEEMVLFPAIVSLERGVHRLAVPLSAPIAMMEHEHDRAGELLTELRLLTDRYEAPEWGCATLRALYAGLQEFEAAMHVHVHLENNVLFPRALQLAEAGVTG